MIDIDKAIAAVVRTGKVSFGTNSAIQNVKTGKVKLIILASNCPKNTREDVEYYSKLSDVPIVTYKGSSTDLAAVCGKPFSISALSIREPGDSEILKLTESTEPEESSGGNE
jgi:large subunit ribosomal protein L30e